MSRDTFHDTFRDAFERIALALRESWSERDGAWHTASARTRNLLLDACGSDHRALVELLLSVGDEIRSALDGSSDSARWETRRAPMVHRLVATRFLQTDISRWLVDTWAYAVGIVPTVPASPAILLAEASASHTASPGVARSAGVWPAATPAMAARGLAAPGPRKGARAHSAPTLSPKWQQRSQIRMSPAELARIKRIERVSLGVLALSVFGGFIAEGIALYRRPLERGAVRSGTTSSASMATLPPTSNGLTDAMPLTPFAGRYRVTHATTSVNGGDGCDAVAGALAQQRASLETVEVDGATSTVRLIDRGVSGHLETDGRFSTGPDSGVTNGVRWSFTMQGRFTAVGFTAQSQKTTDALLAWHKSRSCGVLASLTGTRLP